MLFIVYIFLKVYYYFIYKLAQILKYTFIYIFNIFYIKLLFNKSKKYLIIMKMDSTD